MDRAKTEVNRIEAEATTRTKAIQEQTANIISARKDKLEQTKKAELERLRQIKEAEAKAETTNILLEKKGEFMDKVIAAAKDTLVKQNKKRDYARKLLEKAEKELSVDRVYSKKEGAPQLKKVTVVNRDIDGIIAENKDGSISIDYSFDTLLANIRRFQIKEIAKVLFS